MEKKTFNKGSSVIQSKSQDNQAEALWKSIEKDWQQWIEPFDLMLMSTIFYGLPMVGVGSSISDVANLELCTYQQLLTFQRVRGTWFWRFSEEGK